MLKEADKINCRVFLTPQIIVTANEEMLNLAFLANLFNKFSGLKRIPQICADVGMILKESTF